MFIVFKFAFQLWHTMDKEDEKEQVRKGAITPEEYKDIVGEDYTEEAA